MGYSFKLSVCGFVCIFHYFLKKCNNLFGYFAWTFGRYYSGGPKCIKLFSKLSLFPEELLSVIFCLFLCIITFLIFIYFLRTIQLLHSIFLHMFLVLIRGLLYYRNLFTAFLGILWLIWGMLFYFWELSSSPSYHLKFYTDVFLYYSYSLCTKENFTRAIPLLR